MQVGLRALALARVKSASTAAGMRAEVGVRVTHDLPRSAVSWLTITRSRRLSDECRPACNMCELSETTGRTRASTRGWPGNLLPGGWCLVTTVSYERLGDKVPVSQRSRSFISTSVLFGCTLRLVYPQLPRPPVLPHRQPSRMFGFPVRAVSMPTNCNV